MVRPYGGCPDLIEDVLPGLWKRAGEIPWYDRSLVGISEKEVRDAFGQLMLHNSRFRESHCFCFFIDGLDEYDEAEYVWRDMTNILNDWHDESPGTVKLCISSREDNVFMDAFPADTRLRLHELTKPDIETYVRDKLGSIKYQDTKDLFVREIPSRAHEIFLWVALVVRLVREQAENDPSPTTLRKYMDSLPEKLEELFQHIFDSMHKTDRIRACQVLAMIRISEKHLEIAWLALHAYPLRHLFSRGVRGG